MKRIAFCLLLLSITSNAEQNDPIDSDLITCLSKNSFGSNSFAQQCVLTASRSWQSKIGSLLANLNTRLTQQGKLELARSQTEWEKYRAQQFRLIDSMFMRIEFSGTMYAPIKEQEKMFVLKNRAIELEDYIKHHEW